MRSGMVLGLMTTLITVSSHAQSLRIWRGRAPGSEQWTQREDTIRDTPIGTVVVNVVTPTLTAYLPSTTNATGTGVIIAPGGAFVALAIDLEGYSLARWLQQQGIAAFVLKYRTVAKRQEGIPAMNPDTAGRYGIADGIQALRIARQRARQWGLCPERIGFVGFSAGAMVASGALLQSDTTGRPGFAALIYGAPFGVMPRVSGHLPPIFMAWAEDDAIATGPATRFRDALAASGNPPEVHIYESGGHGFGIRHQGTASDQWLDDFHSWLETQGLTHRPARAC